MKKNGFLSLVVGVALALGGVGGAAVAATESLTPSGTYSVTTATDTQAKTQSADVNGGDSNSAATGAFVGANGAQASVSNGRVSSGGAQFGTPIDNERPSERPQTR